ncbi:MAG: flagellar basal body rod protein FlgC [Melioribacteraceae bacterium]|nr:flagellar basal body rod protein FlgC [Melioribacteraceae bacterium]MCF8353738.1 flagellar basal body rod protein FlgC [Melioribacteraceae bacterium]MCF8392453.1 flagellar basal body rod protein FlgC [Melioribacteraceae bacterium]MCF8418364.1 flagellar basal body rod protein FlgC [Melioribacteraceae bacterium]
MKIGPNFSSFGVSSKGMSIQRKKMDLISENIANISTTKAENGKPYQKKYLQIMQVDSLSPAPLRTNSGSIGIVRTNSNHMRLSNTPGLGEFVKSASENDKIVAEIKSDNTMGNMEYIPDHPDSDENGYVIMPNVNVVTEMVDMIAATRSYEANLTAFNASKQMTKDSLEI